MKKHRRKSKKTHIIGLLLALLICGIVAEGLIVKFNDTSVPSPNIPREPITMGDHTELSYVVMGDSTAVAQGADYVEGIAVGTAQHLADKYKVTMVNVGESGARAKDVLDSQVPQALDNKPNVVLIAVGANDVTHLTGSSSVRDSLRGTVDQLVKQNCDVKIVITGAAQMGSVPRFPQPLRWLEGWRTGQLNQVFDQLAAQKGLTFARIAQDTGPTFKQNPGLFAKDKFHPNAQGYALWTTVINKALDDALANQTSHCAD